MTNPIIHDGTSHRAMNDAEFQEWQTLKAQTQQLREEEVLRRSAYTSARTKLFALGLTEEEIAALIG